MDDVQVVEEAAEEALGERADDVGVARADRLLDLLGLGLPGRVDQRLREVAAAHDLARLEVRLELRVVDDDVDVAEARGRVRELGEHRLVGRVEALHRPDLDDAAGLVARRDDRVGVGERDAHRLLDEDVEARVERVEHDLGVRAGGRADDDGVEPARVEQRAVVGVEPGDAVARAERLPHGRARLRERRELKPVAERRQIRDVHRLGDEAAADDADPYGQASTAWATFSNASAISSRSCSSQSGERSTWIDRLSSESVRGQSGGGLPASAIASSTGFQYG